PDHDTLVRVLPECLARLRDADVALLEGIAVVARSGSTLRLVRVDDPSLRLGSPPALADALPRDAVLELLPLDREPSLDTRLLAAGVPDLWSELEIARVMSGARRNDPRTEALARRVGAEVALHDTLEVEGSFFGATVRVPAPAAFDGQVLRVIVDVLDDPSLAAPALAPEPRERAAAVARLTTDVPANAPAPRRSEAPPRPKLFDRVRRFFGGEPGRETRETKEAREARVAEPSARDARLFAPRDTLGSQLDRTDGWLDARREVPGVGFAFAPTRLPAPWVYAPQLVVTRFDRRGQRWEPSDVPRPDARGDVGTVAMRGRLPAGESVLPIPIYGELVELRASEGDVAAWRGASGAQLVRLERATELRLRVRLGAAPSFDDARVASGVGALDSFVPDAELPEEVLDFVASFDDEGSPFERALAVRDFVRRRYRYDPSYLEDPAVGRYLSRASRGGARTPTVRPCTSVRTQKHLGAGSVTKAQRARVRSSMRRVGIPAGLASEVGARRRLREQADHPVGARLSRRRARSAGVGPDRREQHRGRSTLAGAAPSAGAFSCACRGKRARASTDDPTARARPRRPAPWRSGAGSRRARRGVGANEEEPRAALAACRALQGLASPRQGRGRTARRRGACGARACLARPQGGGGVARAFASSLSRLRARACRFSPLSSSRRRSCWSG
ncbi:MAG: hypothetical protein R3B99_18205, partial [Polyangiales bacterium]